jgi:hypothetical protein
VLENNVVNYGNYGIHGDNTAPGNDTIAKWLPGAVVLGNVIPPNAPTSSYPAGNYYPRSWTEVQLQADYQLAPTSPYIAGGTDGKAPGFDLAALSAAQQGSAGIPPPAPVPPEVSITSPANGATLTGETVQLEASASDSDGTVTQVAFYANGSLVATATASPWNATWTNVAPGTYDLTAVATDSSGLSTTSATVSITVQSEPTPPSVSITSPSNGATITGTSVTLAASASDADGVVTTVAFYANGSLVATTTAWPWTATWSNVEPGTYRLTAVATDSSGLSTTSAPVDVTVVAETVAPPNVAPSVTITSPSDGSVFAAGTTIQLSAAASDADGSVVRVAYYANGKLIATSTTSGSWSASWANVKQGGYTLTAVATDDDGATTTSAAVSISVRKVNNGNGNSAQGKSGK